ncbi:hypothetical protein AAFF_G00117290 [Aldrovandia affinis]|uniref:Protein kinase domain-containing protein n=1 Tax=Aldrovandia affinis TaxID=143900 RepID=A0AAD7T1R4_9TELE|nr:hypothetical protein AAFF_G00117290 [Aldrovandia affinis]
MSLGENTRDQAMKNLEEKICLFLKTKGDGAKFKALAIAKGVGLASAKDVNKVLYSLEKAHCLQKTGEIPPLWSLVEPSGAVGVKLALCSLVEPSGSEAPDSTAAPSAGEIQNVLRAQTGGQGVTVREIARELNLPRKLINKQLYDMFERGEVEKSENEVPQWTCTDDMMCKKNKQEERHGSFVNIGSDNESSTQPAVSRFAAEYILLEQLGKGGFGQVYKAKQTLDKAYYAIKVVEYTNDALREVEGLAHFRHPNIVRYYTAWRELCHPDPRERNSSTVLSSWSSTQSEDEEDQSGSAYAITISNTPKTYLYIQMELCEGGTLGQWITERNDGETRSKEDALDLKPENILFESDGTVKIGDFGHVTTIRKENGASIERMKRRGTPSYMSPEQENLSEYDEKVDIFALGLIFFKLLWKMATEMERGKIWSDLRERRFPDGFSEQYTSEHALIRKMLSKSPGERPGAEHCILLIGHEGERNVRSV